MAKEPELEDTSTVDDVFKETEVDTPETLETETPELKGETETAEVETEAESDTAPPAGTSEDLGLKSALLDERRRRQVAEDRLTEIQKSQEVIPDPIDDPEAHADYIRRQSTGGRIDGSRETAIEIKPDYEEMEAVFLSMVKDAQGNVVDQSLVNQMNAAKSPALFAYNKAVEHLELEKFRDPAKRAQYESDLKAKLLQEIKDEIANPDAPKVPGVPNLTRASAQGKNTEATIKEVETVSDIFPDS